MFFLDLESRAHISKEHFEWLNRLPVNSRVDHLMSCFQNKEWSFPSIYERTFYSSRWCSPITLDSAAKGHLLFQR